MRTGKGHQRGGSKGSFRTNLLEVDQASAAEATGADLGRGAEPVVVMAISPPPRPGGIADLEFEHEAVQLRLREGIGPLLLDWVLCGQGRRRAAPAEGSRRPPSPRRLLHGLKERRLRSWGRVRLTRRPAPRGKMGALHEAEDPTSGAPVLLDDLGPVISVGIRSRG